MELCAGGAAFPEAAFGAEFGGDGLEGCVFDGGGGRGAEFGCWRRRSVAFFLSGDEGPVGGGVGQCGFGVVVCEVLLCVRCTARVVRRSCWFMIFFCGSGEKTGCLKNAQQTGDGLLSYLCVDAWSAIYLPEKKFWRLNNFVRYNSQMRLQSQTIEEEKCEGQGRTLGDVNSTCPCWCCTTFLQPAGRDSALEDVTS